MSGLKRKPDRRRTSGGSALRYVAKRHEGAGHGWGIGINLQSDTGESSRASNRAPDSPRCGGLGPALRSDEVHILVLQIA